MGLVLLPDQTGETLSLSAHEDTVRRRPSALTRSLIGQRLDLGLPNLQNCEKSMSVAQPSSRWMWFWLPKWTETTGKED